jgi:hypothetical protein
MIRVSAATGQPKRNHQRLDDTRVSSSEGERRFNTFLRYLPDTHVSCLRLADKTRIKCELENAARVGNSDISVSTSKKRVSKDK